MQELIEELAKVLENQNPAGAVALSPYIGADLQRRIIEAAKK
jgi:hypothetical protein